MSDTGAHTTHSEPESTATLSGSDIIQPRIRTNSTSQMTRTEVDDAMEAIPATRRRGAFHALSYRNFRLFFVGQLISVAGTWMQTVAQNWLVWEVTHQARWLGIVSGASALPYVAFAVWGGHVADRYARRAILVITQTVSMLMAFLLALLTTGRWIPLQPWHIAAQAAVLGIVNAFNMPAQQAFVTDMVDDREALSNAIALNSFRFNIARFLGPILAGIVLAKYGAATCFNLNGLSYIAVILSLLMMRLPAFIPHEQKLNVWEGFTYIWRTRSVLRITLLVGAASLFAWSVSNTMYPMLASSFHRGASGYSWMMAMNGVGAALGAVSLATFADRMERRVVIYGGAICFCALLLALAVAPSFWMVLVNLTLSGYFMIAFAMSSNIKVQEDVPDILRGRTMAVYTLVFQGLMPVGGLEIGFLADHLHSAERAIGVNAALCLLISIAIYVWSRVDRQRAEAR